jgi:AraC family transcriptional regulator, regulatory protein of adaptative response / methylated-DNA-[protein]-cysteine methyltransferase
MPGRRARADRPPRDFRVAPADRSPQIAVMPDPTDYTRIAAAIRHLDEHWREQPTLADLSAALGMEELALQRLFTRWAGISPKRFLQHRTAEAAKRFLREGPNVLDASWESGLSGPGRLHDLIVNAEAVTPGEYRRGGEGVGISYGFHESPFGECLVAQSSRGIVHLAFIDPVPRREALARLRSEWPAATIREDPRATSATASRVFTATRTGAPIALHVRGTNFQLKVWRALLAIPEGSFTNYGQLARAVGSPRGARAVGGAVGSNPISYLIPCHRVLRADGGLGGYAWGVDRKRVMVGYEVASGR